MSKTLPLLVLLTSTALFAQTTTNYTVAAPTSGVYSSPFRAFSIPLSNGAEVNWLEVGRIRRAQGRSCLQSGSSSSRLMEWLSLAFR